MSTETIEIRNANEKVIFSGTVKELIDSYLYEISERERLELEALAIEEDNNILEDQYFDLSKQYEKLEIKYFREKYERVG